MSGNAHSCSPCDLRCPSCNQKWLVLDEPYVTPTRANVFTRIWKSIWRRDGKSGSPPRKRYWCPSCGRTFLKTSRGSGTPSFSFVDDSPIPDHAADNVDAAHSSSSEIRWPEMEHSLGLSPDSLCNGYTNTSSSLSRCSQCPSPGFLQRMFPCMMPPTSNCDRHERSSFSRCNNVPRCIFEKCRDFVNRDPALSSGQRTPEELPFGGSPWLSEINPFLSTSEGSPLDTPTPVDSKSKSCGLPKPKRPVSCRRCKIWRYMATTSVPLALTVTVSIMSYAWMWL